MRTARRLAPAFLAALLLFGGGLGGRGGAQRTALPAAKRILLPAPAAALSLAQEEPVPAAVTVQAREARTDGTWLRVRLDLRRGVLEVDGRLRWGGRSAGAPPDPWRPLRETWCAARALLRVGRDLWSVLGCI